jgi:hypothetical protein
MFWKKNPDIGGDSAKGTAYESNFQNLRLTVSFFTIVQNKQEK